MVVGAIISVKSFKRKHNVSVHLTTGRTVDGVLVSTRGDYLELRKAGIEVDGKMVPADGVLLLPKKRVEFVQVTP